MHHSVRHLKTMAGNVTEFLSLRLYSLSDISETAQCTRARICPWSTHILFNLPFLHSTYHFNHARVHPVLRLTVVDIRLGQPLFSGHTACLQCATRRGPTPVVGPVGIHARTCKVAKGGTRHHNALLDTITTVLSQQHVAVYTAHDCSLVLGLYLKKAHERSLTCHLRN